MKFALLNDTHVGFKNGSEIYLDYQEEFYSKIFFPYLLENNIKRIVHLGDFFDHRRFINFKVINHNRKMFLDELRKNGIFMDIIPGNHDCAYKNTNSLCSLKELLGHYTDCIKIHMTPTVVDYDGLNVALLPWIAPDEQEQSFEFIRSCNAQILMGHLELAGFKFMAHSNIVSHGSTTTMLDRFEAVYSGHYHTKSTQKNITYLGTQFEFTWSDCDDPKFFHIYDTDTRTIMGVRNPITIFKKIYFDDEPPAITPDDINGKYVKVIVLSKKDSFLFEKFIDKIQSYNPISIGIVESLETPNELEEQDYTIENTETLINEYIDNIDTKFDKNVIKKMMQQLYIEASSSEV